jgi:hypothetical protein
MLMKSILVHLTNPFFNFRTETFFHLEAACSSSCCVISRVVKEQTMERTLVGALDKDIQCILMINQELHWKKYEQGRQRALVGWWAAAK